MVNCRERRSAFIFVLHLGGYDGGIIHHRPVLERIGLNVVTIAADGLRVIPPNPVDIDDPPG
jgi:hypothetical protein